MDGSTDNLIVAPDSALIAYRAHAQKNLKLILQIHVYAKQESFIYNTLGGRGCSFGKL